MKRFWLVLLSLGLIVAFSTASFAQVTVRNSGEFYIAGMYLDRTNVADVAGTNGQSTAFYFQRLRLNTTFIVSPGLMLMTRADIMERAWGAQRSQVPLDTTNDILSAGTRAENENIAFDLAYLTYISPIGIIQGGYMIDGAWGTVFGDNSQPTGKIAYAYRGGPVTAGIQTGKSFEGSRTAINGVNAADRDTTFLTIFGIYAWKTGQAGLLGKYIDDRSNRGGDTFPGTHRWVMSVLPYVKAQLGPVALQAEVIYSFGKAKFEDEAIPTLRSINILYDEVKLQGISAWVDAVADLGMFYAGGTVAYVSGDDPATADKREGIQTGGIDWNPALIMFNNDLNYWAGAQAGYDGTVNAGAMTNAYFAQIKGGVRPVEKLDIGLAVSYAHADKTRTVASEGRGYGWEVDVTATYKLTNNLSYMLGAGYLFTGDYYKGTPATTITGPKDVQNNYLILNKLTLTF